MRVAPEPDREVTSTRGDIVVTGAASALGRRLCARLAADVTVGTVLALDREPVPGGDRPIDLLVDDVKDRVDGATTLVHLASAFGPAVDDDPEVVKAADVEMARRVLDAAAASGTAHLVVLSTATVYGAWPTNPVPLTEEAPLRPDPGLAFAVQKAEIERVTSEWREEHPGATVTVLRPATPVADGQPGWLARALRSAGEVRSPDDDPPVQFLHLDDLVAAIDLAARERLDGVFNVAPDGWLTPTEFRELAGGTAKLRVPRWVVDRVTDLRWRLRLGSAPPPGVLAYARGSWVVANDRLKAAGWEPTVGNDEAYVGAVPAGPLATLSPRRRQELALGATGVLAAGLVVGAVALVRRARRRSRT
jgi:nucleoside-diphosphate-sugar epimerase